MISAIQIPDIQESRMQRKASAVWKGGLKDGKGAVSSGSGVLSEYSLFVRDPI